MALGLQGLDGCTNALGCIYRASSHVFKRSRFSQVFHRDPTAGTLGSLASDVVFKAV